MASWISSILYLLIMLSSLYAIPVKQVDNIEKRGATDADCYGTKCYYEYEEDQEVKLRENLTEAIMSVLPAVKSSQTKIVKLLNQSLVSSQERNGILAGLLYLKELRQEDKVDTRNVEQLLDDIKTTVNEGFRGLTEQMQDLTGSMNLLANSIIISLSDDSQLSDMEMNSGGWTVFQRRFDGAVDFNRGWEDYENGFGNPDGEYWLGLRNIWRLTRNRRMVLRIDMEAFDGDTAYAVYDSFAVGDAASNYQLTIGSYSGTAGDSLISYHNNMEFSTKDRDNDSSSVENCAESYKGGWWFNGCLNCNLNGLYGLMDNSGMLWKDWKGWNRSVKSTEMKIRRA